MKDLQKLLQRHASLQGNPVFERLYQELEQAEKALDDAKKAKTDSKTAYQDAIESGERDEVALLELLTTLRQDKYMHLHEKAGYQLAKYKMEHFLDQQHPHIRRTKPRK